MSKPYELDRAFSQLEPNFALLAELYEKNQKEYIRRRLKAIRLLWEGKTRSEVQWKLDVDGSTLIEWLRIIVNNGVDAGLRQLSQAKKVHKEPKLTFTQEQALLAIVSDKSPRDFGYDQHIFTAKILQEIVHQQWEIDGCDQTIYNLFQRHHWSYQRAHRDYENADAEEQRAFAEELKQTIEHRDAGQEIYFFDEFSTTNRPTLFYGWAPINTKFRVPSDEKKKNAAEWVLGC